MTIGSSVIGTTRETRAIFRRSNTIGPDRSASPQRFPQCFKRWFDDNSSTPSGLFCALRDFCRPTEVGIQILSGITQKNSSVSGGKAQSLQKPPIYQQQIRVTAVSFAPLAIRRLRVSCGRFYRVLTFLVGPNAWRQIDCVDCVMAHRTLTSCSTRGLMAIGLFGAIIFLVTARPSVAAPLPRSVVAALLADADVLYAQAADIVGSTPSTEDAADSIGGSAGRRFHANEARFQDRAYPLNPPPAGTSDTLNDAIVRLNQFDNFVNDAVNSALICKGAEARADLRIARQLLSHARDDYNGKLQTGWDPNLDVPDEKKECER